MARKNQKKCPYCHYDDAGLVKPLIKYAGAADLMGDLVRYTAINSFKGIFDKDEPLDVKIIAYFEVPKSLSKKRKALCLANKELPTKKPDADNVGKIIMDGMNPKMKRDKRLHKMVEVMRGVYQDDKQVTTLLVKKRYSERPRVEVRVKRDTGELE